MCPPFRASGQMAARPSITFPLPPLKFRTAGFPQYGFKSAIRTRPSRPPCGGCLYAPVARRAHLCPLALPLSGGGRGVGERPTQRPLARQRVVLSRRVVAYYGLIRGSGPLPPTSFALYGGSLPEGQGPERPYFYLHVLASMPPSIPRRSDGPSTVGGSVRASLRPVTRGSAPTSSGHQSVHAREIFRGCKSSRWRSVASCCGLDACSPFTDQGFYLRAFTPPVARTERRV